MVRSRYLLFLTLALATVFALSSIAWAGPAPRPEAERQDQPPQQPPNQNQGQGQGDMGGGGGATTFGGGIMSPLSLNASSVPVGSAGGSPALEYDDLGMKNNITYTVRAAHHFRDVGFSMYADFLFSSAHGEGNYSGPTILSGQNSSVQLRPGDDVEADLNVNIFTLTGDIGLNALSSSASGGDYQATSFMEGGPRIQYARLGSDFRYKNLSVNMNDTGGKNEAYSMLGLGGFTTINLGAMTGYGYFGSNISVSPVIKAACAYGGGSKMRYFTWEALVALAKGKVDLRDWTPNYMLEAGIMSWETKGVGDDNEFPTTGGVLFLEDTSFNMRFQTFVLRAAMSF